jgi:hypothetical protein
MAGKPHRDPWGIEVPGGFVTTERRGGAALLVSAFRSGIFSAGGVEQHIVVKDGPHGQELYREGPFDAVTVRRPLQSIAAKIEAVGLAVFLRRKHIENAQLGPVNAPSGRSTLASYFKTWIKTLGGRRRSNPD